MNTQKTKVLASLIIVAMVVGAGWYFLKGRGENKITNQNIVPSPSAANTVLNANGNTVNLNDYVGTISTSTDGQKSLYTSVKYGLRFSYPIEWRVGDNHLGYGTFQLFNYEESIANKHFSEGQNKIEIVIGTDDFLKPSSDYPQKTNQSKQIKIDGHIITRHDIELVDGEKYRTYALALPRGPSTFLFLTIYGDPSNFSVLDEIVQSIEWTK
jgi:hypothetical protein